MVVALVLRAWPKNVTRRHIVTFLLIIALAIFARFVAFAAQNTDIQRADRSSDQTSKQDRIFADSAIGRS